MATEVEAPPLYKTILSIVEKPMKWFHRMETIGLENLPAKGKGFVLAPRHNGIFDAAFVSIAIAEGGRGVRWITDDEIQNNPVFGPFLKGIGCIAISVHKGKAKDKEQIKQAMAEAREAMENGDVVGLFPEGEIRPFFEPPEPYPFRAGILRLALEAKVPIIPAWAEGAERVLPWVASTAVNEVEIFLVAPLWLPTQVKVHFGEPFVLNPKLTLDSSKEAFIDEADRLRDTMRNLMGLP